MSATRRRVGELPAEVSWVRETPRWTSAEIPAGLRKAHRVAAGVWGLLRVHAGQVAFVEEDSGARHDLEAGDELVIRPALPHHLEPGEGAVVSVAFYR